MSDSKNTFTAVPFSGEIPTDELSKEAANALKVLNGLKAGDQINFGEVLANYLTLLHFLIRQDNVRQKEYRLLLTAINEVKDEFKEVKEISNGLQKSGWKEKLRKVFRRRQKPNL